LEKLDAYLTIREAADFLGVSANTLRNWGRDDKVPMHRNPINGYRLFKRVDLERLLKRIDRSRNGRGGHVRKAK
jgi:excisionase family DNA binding protein